MTILTKAVGDKKIDKSDLPLVAAVDVRQTIIKSKQLFIIKCIYMYFQTGHDDVKNDVESSIASIEERRIHRARRVSTATTLCLFLTALLVLSIGVIGGVYIYSQYARARMHRFHGWCNIPYDGTKVRHITHSLNIYSVLIYPFALLNIRIPLSYTIILNTI